jgi:hypothetical protein
VVDRGGVVFTDEAVRVRCAVLDIMVAPMRGQVQDGLDHMGNLTGHRGRSSAADRKRRAPEVRSQELGTMTSESL